jgi:hypothetical protein
MEINLEVTNVDLFRLSDGLNRKRISAWSREADLS